jgi:N-carbamoylputrescine amidase
VPVVHAAHAGKFKSGLPMLPGFPYQSYFLGETQIVDGTGKQLARMGQSDGDGFVTADIDIKQRNMVSESIPDSFWIPDLPVQLKMIWAMQNWHGKRYYRKKIRPLMQKQFNDMK